MSDCPPYFLDLVSDQQDIVTINNDKLIVFHLYRHGCAADSVTLDDKKVSQFYFHQKPFQFTTFKTQMYLGGDKQCPLLAEISLRGLQVTITDSWGRMYELKGRFFSFKYDFQVQGITYAWKHDGWSRHLILLRYPEKEQVANFEYCSFAMSKVGKLFIQPCLEFMAPLILASAYAMITLQRRQQDSSAAS